MYDTIIIGARSAGAATAMLLARQGQRVLLIDRSAPGADTLSTHALMRGAVVQLDRWGLLDKVVEAETPEIQTTTFHYGDRAPIRLDIKPRHGVGALYAPRRTVLDPIMVDAARTAGVDVRYGLSLIGLARRGQTVVGVIVRDRRGHTQRFDARFVVGADGMRSTVARLTSAPIYQAARTTTATLYGYFNGLHHDGYQWFYSERTAAGAIPTNDGLTCIFVGMRPERLERERHDVEAAFRGALEDAAPGLRRQVEHRESIVSYRRFSGLPGYLRQSFGPGWALVGDAGYFKDPLTAHGMTDALIDAELLAHALCVGTPDALAEYQAQRDRRARPMLELTDEVASFDWDLPTLSEYHKALSRLMQSEVDDLPISSRRGAAAA